MKKIRIKRPQSYHNISILGIKLGSDDWKKIKISCPDLELIEEKHFYFHAYNSRGLYFKPGTPYLDEIVIELPDDGFVTVSKRLG